MNMEENCWMENIHVVTEQLAKRSQEMITKSKWPCMKCRYNGWILNPVDFYGNQYCHVGAFRSILFLKYFCAKNILAGGLIFKQNKWIVLNLIRFSLNNEC